jgi:hypothetical protein
MNTHASRKNPMNKIFLVTACALLAALSCVPAFAQNPPSPPRPATIPPGLYVSVTDGQIMVSNKGGATNFTAGQFGYTASLTQPPIVVPKNPAILFTPPPTFSPSSAIQGATAAGKAGTVDCEVR